MCGIFCTIIHNQNTFLNEIVKNKGFKETNPQFAEYFDALLNRGPDEYKELLVDISPRTVIQFAGSVLWTQGPNPTAQPLHDEDDVLLWNGDIFFGPLAGRDNDTKRLWTKLKEVQTSSRNIAQVFSSIKGPFSFIYYAKKMKRLFFGRDFIGRHSLLIGFTQRSLTITSVASRKVEGYVEVPALGIFSLNLEQDGKTPITVHPWSHTKDTVQNVLNILPKKLFENYEVEETIQSYIQPPRRNSTTPSPNDLDMWRVQDQNVSLSNLLLKITHSDAKTRIRQTMEALMKKSSIQILVDDLLSTLKEAVKVRVEKQPNLCKNCVLTSLGSPSTSRICSHAKLAVLFSGGLDSAVLASLVHQFVPPEDPIDLLNVAFEKTHRPNDVKESNEFRKREVKREISFTVPDRITGLSTLNELKVMHPDRIWNFVEINISEDELKNEREKIISHLIYPLNTILDDSLGCALWFASRGKGFINERNEPYTSPSRVIISGIGADEQLGGYMRHRTTLKHRGGWEALDKELQFELKRISQRNLGRDDRIVADHGRQLRMPYLDEDVINYLSFLPPWNRCYPVDSMPPGVGDKLLLRLTAWHLGFRNAANLPKKAMQFGSRIANSREKGDDVSGRLNY